jgi:hypothetical protein
LLWPKLSGGNIIGLGGNPNQQSEKFDKFHQNHEKPWNHMMWLDNWTAKIWENRQNTKLILSSNQNLMAQFFTWVIFFCGKF